MNSSEQRVIAEPFGGHTICGAKSVRIKPKFVTFFRRLNGAATRSASSPCQVLVFGAADGLTKSTYALLQRDSPTFSLAPTRRLAEGVGFEPTVGCPTLDFESSALNRTQPPFLNSKKTSNGPSRTGVERPTFNVECKHRFRIRPSALGVRSLPYPCSPC